MVEIDVHVVWFELPFDNHIGQQVRQGIGLTRKFLARQVPYGAVSAIAPDEPGRIDSFLKAVSVFEGRENPRILLVEIRQFGVAFNCYTQAIEMLLQNRFGLSLRERDAVRKRGIDFVLLRLPNEFPISVEKTPPHRLADGNYLVC